MGEERCNVCGLVKTASNTGSITQYISSCKCDLTKFASSESRLDICVNCGKRIGQGRKGTMTGYILRSSLCECANPRTLASLELARDVEPAFEGVEIGESELDVEEENFPIDRYTPYLELGRGASGCVYLAKDKMLGKKVAIKVLNSLDSSQLIAFQEEAKATSKLSHPNIVQIMDFGITSGDAPYMVLEYLGGVSLDKYLERVGTLDQETAVRLFIQLCNALDSAHEKGIFHRDLKPSNIILHGTSLDNCVVKLIDFGVAKMQLLERKTMTMQEATLAGTPAYMSPDLVRGLPYGARAEIYSLGCVLYESLAGKPPFKGESALDTMRMHVEEELTEIDTGVSEKLKSIVYRCLSKDPELRYQSMEALRDDFQKLERLQDLQDTRVLLGSKTSKKIILVVLALVVVPLTVLGIALRPESAVKTEVRIQPPDVSLIEEKPIDMREYYLNPSLSNADYSDDSLKYVASKLRKRNGGINLNLFRWKVNGSGLAHLEGLPIERIILSSTNITDENLIYLKGFHLKDLIVESTGITGAGLKHLEDIDSLERLDLYGCKKLRDDDLKNLYKNRHLIKIVISDTGLGDSSLVHISKCRSIEKLMLDSLPITDEGVEHLTRLNNLSEISISHCPNLTKKTLKLVLEKFPHLRNLWIVDMKIKPEDLKGIEKHDLHTLDIKGININDSVMKRISALKNLKYLYISGSEIDDASLKNLYELRFLEDIQLINCPRLTQAGMGALRKNLPQKAKIFPDSYNNPNLDTVADFIQDFSD